MDSVKVALGGRSMTVEAARQSAKDKKEWKALVHMQMIEFNAAMIAWPCVLLDCPAALW